MASDILSDRRARLTIATPVDDPTDFQHTTTNIVEINGGKTDDSNRPGLRVRFKIEKSLTKQPNTGEIVVTNMAPSRRADLQVKGVRVLLEAGYRDRISRLFSGDVRTADSVHAGADWETAMRLGDGERAWQFARVDESFNVGTRMADVIKTVARATGLELGNVDTQAAKINRVFDQGFAVAGKAVQALDGLVTSIGKELSIQDGQLQILDPYESLDLPIPELTPESGLIGSPEMGPPETKGKPALLRFKCLLLAVKPGSKVRLKSERYEGYIRIHKISHDGDTHGGAWYSTINGSIVK